MCKKFLTLFLCLTCLFSFVMPINLLHADSQDLTVCTVTAAKADVAGSGQIDILSYVNGTASGWQANSSGNNGDVVMTLTMDKVYQVSKISMNIGSFFYGSFDILVSTDGNTWSDKEGTISASPYELDFQTPISAQYIKLVSASGYTGLELNGITVYSAAIPTPTPTPSPTPTPVPTATPAPATPATCTVIAAKADVAGTGQVDILSYVNSAASGWQANSSGSNGDIVLTLTLDNIYQVGKISMDIGSFFYGSFNVLTSTDGNTWSAPVGTISASPYELDLQTPVSAQYIRLVSASGFTGLELNGITVYPAAAPTPTPSPAPTAVPAETPAPTTPATYTVTAAKADVAGTGQVDILSYVNGTASGWQANSSGSNGDIVLTLTLDNTYQIGKISMEIGSYFYGSFNVLASSDGSTWSDSIGTINASPYELDLQTSVSAKYIKLVSASGYTGLELNGITICPPSSQAPGGTDDQYTGTAKLITDKSLWSAKAASTFDEPNAISGNPATSLSTGSDPNTELMLDMGQTQSVSKVTMLFGANCGGSFDVYLSADGQSYTKYGTIAYSANDTKFITISPAQQARYIKFQQTQWSAINLYDIEVLDQNSVTIGHNGWKVSLIGLANVSTGALAGTGNGWTNDMTTKSWIRLDLGSSYCIAGLELTCGAGSTGSFDVRLASVSKDSPPTASIGTINVSNGKTSFYLPESTEIQNNCIWLIPKSDTHIVLKNIEVRYFEPVQDTVTIDHPVITRVSQGVAPGRPMSVYGDGFFGTSIKVKLVEANLELTPEQINRQVVTVVLPPDLIPGTYTVNISDDNGTNWYGNPSSSIKVNAVDVRWASDDAGYPGMKLSIFGQNLNASEYGGTVNTQVQLVSGGTAVPVTVTSVTPYRIDAVLPIAAPGTYKIQVNTNAQNCTWTTLKNFPDTTDTDFVMKAAPNNPDALALGISWADSFNWNNIINAKTSYNAKGDGVTDDTAAIQSAINAAEAAGGGIVYLPAGSYVFSGLVLGKGVVLKGDGEATKLLFYVANPDSKTTYMAFSSKGDGSLPGTAKHDGYHGIYNLMLQVKDNEDVNVRAVEFGWQREEIWGKTFVDGANYTDTMTAKDMFVVGCTIDFGLDGDRIGKYHGLSFTGSDVLILNNKITVPGDFMWNANISKRVDLISNTIDYANDYTAVSSEKAILSGNKITGHNIPGKTTNLHGFFANESSYGFNIWNTYIGQNQISNVGSVGLNGQLGNDGEGVTLDSFDRKLFGTVRTADATNISGLVDSLYDPVYWKLSDTEWMVAIVGGTGAGQIRKLSSYSVSSDNSTFSLSVSKPWDIVPDRTSKINIARFHYGVIIEQNRMDDTAVGVQLYNGCYDVVAADNTLNNTGGAIIYSSFAFNSVGSMGPSYFCSVKRNIATGSSRGLPNGVSWIGLRTEAYNSPAYGYNSYGNEFRDNSIDRKGIENVLQIDDGIYPAGYFISERGSIQDNDTSCDVLGTLFDSNIVKNSNIGLTIDKPCIYNTFVHNMLYQNTTTTIQDKGTNTIVYNTQDTAPPATPTFSLSTSAPTNEDITVTIVYPSDMMVKQYKIGQNGVWTDYSSAITVSNNDTVFAKCENISNVWSNEGSIIIANIDKTPPSDPTLSAVVNNAGTGNVTVTIAYPSDAAVRKYKVGSTGTWTDYTAPVSDTIDDTIYAKCQDIAGNWSNVASLAMDKPYQLQTGTLNRTSGLTATASISNNALGISYTGNAVVVFQLMRDSTPVSIVAVGKSNLSQETFNAYFNVADPANTSYRVKVFVFDVFNSDTGSVPVILASPVTLN